MSYHQYPDDAQIQEKAAYAAKEAAQRNMDQRIGSAISGLQGAFIGRAKTTVPTPNEPTTLAKLLEALNYLSTCEIHAASIRQGCFGEGDDNLKNLPPQHTLDSAAAELARRIASLVSQLDSIRIRLGLDGLNT